MQATPGRLLSVLSAVIVLAAAAPAQAAPPSKTTSTYMAPYSGYAATSSYSSNCLSTSTCTVEGAADSKVGEYSTTAHYLGAGDGSEVESIHGSSFQYVAFRVPRGASKVTATFTWDVTSAQVSANATEGFVAAQSGLGASTYCGTGCTVTRASATKPLAHAYSQDGVPQEQQAGVSPDEEVDVTLSVSGDLPRHLYLRGHTYGWVSAGRTALLCLHQDACARPGHDGEGTAKVAATLLQVHVTAE